ncbi:MAG: diaminopimelate decarboxylase [Candidatus Kapabacteria bacterium]|nr:diaminopimelate decarboxylase [Candidatus Kapabacteria bacterium]
MVDVSQDGTLPVDAIIELAGTPVYVYQADIIEQKLARLRNAFASSPVRIMYACKALTNGAVLRLMNELGTGLDAVSLQEVQLGLRAGFSPRNILFTPSMIAFEELCAVAEMGVQVNIDTISVLERFGTTYGGSIPVCIRINPHIMAGGNDRISTGHIDSKFGISIHQIRHVLRVVRSHNMSINGLHMHTGSDILNADVFLQGAELLFEIAESFPDLTFLDFGSGFKVAYKPDDTATDVEELGAKLCGRLSEFNATRERPVELWLEPGKFLVSESGTFLTRVNVVKQTTSTVFAGVDSGFNHLIRPMLYNAYHHITNLSNPNGVHRVYSIVGYICETDTFAWDRKIAEIREGDVLAFANAGAYGFSMASNYNSRLRPAEVMVRGGSAHLIRRRETLEDLVRTEIES